MAAIAPAPALALALAAATAGRAGGAIVSGGIEDGGITGFGVSAVDYARGKYPPKEYPPWRVRPPVLAPDSAFAARYPLEAQELRGSYLEYVLPPSPASVEPRAELQTLSPEFGTTTSALAARDCPSRPAMARPVRRTSTLAGPSVATEFPRREGVAAPPLPPLPVEDQLQRPPRARLLRSWTSRQQAALDAAQRLRKLLMRSSLGPLARTPEGRTEVNLVFRMRDISKMRAEILSALAELREEGVSDTELPTCGALPLTVPAVDAALTDRHGWVLSTYDTLSAYRNELDALRDARPQRVAARLASARAELQVGARLSEALAVDEGMHEFEYARAGGSSGGDEAPVVLRVAASEPPASLEIFDGMGEEELRDVVCDNDAFAFAFQAGMRAAKVSYGLCVSLPCSLPTLPALPACVACSFSRFSVC